MATTKCPHCGQPIELIAARPTRAAWTAARAASVPGRHESTAEFITPQTAGSLRPGRPAEVASDVHVPALQSLFTGVAVGMLSVVPTAYLGLPWWSPLAAAGAGTSVTWIILLRSHRRMLWLAEIASGQDLDGDGVTGDPAAPVRHEVAVQEGRKTTIIDLFADPKDPAAVYRFIRLVAANGRTFSERGAAKSGYSVELFRQLREEFLLRGLCQWKHPTDRRQGVIFTHWGKRTIEALATLPYPGSEE